jgi:sigma-B regulation protein RsbU (phosphoserine phosphatase)
MALAVYDADSRTLKIANAGLPRALRFSAGEIGELPVDGLPLGMFEGVRYVGQTLTTRTGDVVVFCSDGLLECEDAGGAVFGSARIRDVLRELLPTTAQEIADGLNRAGMHFAGNGSRQSDDHTVVVLKFT